MSLRRPAPILLLLAALMLAFLVAPRPARADQQDIAAAARSVVRVALVATRGGDGAYFVGHGSGIVVAPDKVLTNAHVVELVRDEPNIVIGIVPPEGKRSYGARIIAFSPGNDLALLQLSEGRLTPATFFSSATQDGQAVVAIGYPGNVDRAQGMTLPDIIQPMTPVKTSGTISTGRSSRQYDTVLHTAPMAAGNSGGPLVDTCGRVVGVNSFGSISDGNDAEYGFAVSNREVGSFLRQAGVQPLRTIATCRSLAEIDAAERSAADQARLRAEAQAAADADRERERAIRARQDAEQSVIAGRENFIAVAAILLALALVCAGVAGIGHVQGKAAQRRNFAIASGILFIAALTAFFLRPSFSQVDDRAADLVNAMHVSDGDSNAGTVRVIGDRMAGENICRIAPERSRITVSETPDVPLRWQGSGCIDGTAQLVENGGIWNRILVRDDDPVASILTVDPGNGTYRVDRYALDATTADTARKAQEATDFKGCSTDPARLQALARQQAGLRALLPPEPNERLVYRCSPGKVPAEP